MTAAVIVSASLNALNVAAFTWLVKTGHITVRKPPRPKPKDPSMTSP